MTEVEDPFEAFRHKKEADHQDEIVDKAVDEWVDKGDRAEGEEGEERPKGYMSHRYIPPKVDEDELERPEGFEDHKHESVELKEEEIQKPKGFTRDRFD